MTTSLALRVFFQFDSTLLGGSWPAPRETESLPPLLEVPMVERALRTTRDANTTLVRTHKDGIPILQVPFRKA